MNIRMYREWAMPNGNTFSIPPIGRFIASYMNSCSGVSIDPFANRNRLAQVTNDLDPAMGCDYALDALEFLKLMPDACASLVLFDPPYSPRQVSECYKSMGMTVNMQTTQSSFWSNLKAEIARITTEDGVVLSFGWNTNGVGMKRGFDIIEILTVAHGGAHNDTLCTAERKRVIKPSIQATLFG